MFSSMNACAEKCTANLSGTHILKKVADDYAISVISTVVFGVEDSTGFIESTRSVYQMKGFQGFRMWFRFLAPEWANFFRVRTTPPEVEKFFREALERGERKPGGLLDQLFKLKENDPEFTDVRILSQFFSFALAGFETVSTTVMFCLYELSKHPDIQSRARKEIEEALNDQPCTFDALRNMFYLEAIINETLRMYPPAPGSVRLNETPYKLPCGAVLPAGTSVFVSFFALHRDAKYFHEPDIFKPERFLDQSFNQKAFMPFGLGPRICLGMKFALLEIKTFLCNLLYNYHLSLNQKTKEPFEESKSNLFFDTEHPFFCDFSPIDRTKHL